MSYSVRVFDVGEVDDIQLAEAIEELTGQKPILSSRSKPNPRTNKSNAIIRLTKAQYSD